MQLTLTAHGIELNPHLDKFGDLADSTDLLGDSAALQERLPVEGYLSLPGYLDKDTVLAARREILSE